MNSPDLLAALTPVIDVLDKTRIRYLIGGSVASSLYGVARATLDVDLVADLSDADVEPFVTALADEYYIEGSTVREAVRVRGSFNIIHLGSMLKIDVFVLRDDDYEREALRRGEAHRLEGEGASRSFRVGSPEDVILHKLAWFRSGGEVSERQWRDVQGVLAVQGDSLDTEYLARWAAHLRVSDLLVRALSEVEPEA